VHVQSLHTRSKVSVAISEFGLLALHVCKVCTLSARPAEQSRDLLRAFHAAGALKIYGPTAMPLGCPNAVSEPLILAIGATLPLLLAA